MAEALQEAHRFLQWCNCGNSDIFHHYVANRERNHLLAIGKYQLDYRVRWDARLTTVLHVARFVRKTLIV